MAKGNGQTLENLYIGLGLDMSQLQADLIAADRTVTENLGRLNREKNTIKIRMEADISGLDRVADSAKILEIQEKALNQQLALSKDKLSMLEAAYQQVVNNQNSSVMAVQRAEQAFQKQRLEVEKLESQLKSLSAQKISIDTTQLQDKIAQINAKINNIKLKAQVDVSQLSGANSAFDAQKVHIAAVTQELELQRQKMIQLRATMYQSAQKTGGDSVQTLNIKSNVLQQIQEISRLETKLKELQGMNINLQVRADSLRQVESQIHENISRINAHIENIRVKADIDVSKLGTMASEFDKAKAHVQGLNHELDLQNQKLAEMRRALATSVSANGLNNVKTINLQTEIQKQIQAIDQLKAKINELNKIEPPKTNSLLSNYLNIKGDAVGKLNEISTAFANLKGATSSADNAITSSLNVIGAIPHPVGRAVAAFASMPLVIKGVENSLLDLTRTAAASGDAVYVMSRGFQMSIADTGKFTTTAKVAGVQVNDLAAAVRNVQRQVARGGEDSRAAEWLERYGESAYDANGNLKDLNEMTFSLSRALKKAQADGKGAEFVLNAFRNVSADAITAIEDWADVSDQASKIVKAGLANPKLAHEVQGNLNALNVQSAQLSTSFTNALLPVANEIIPKVTERTAELTRLISDNKDLIKDFGETIGNGFLAVEGIVDKAAKGLILFGGGLRDIYNYRKASLVDRYKDDDTVQSVQDLMKKELWRSYTPQERAAIEVNPNLYNQIMASYEPIMKAIDDTRKEVEEKTKALNDALKNAPISFAEASTIAAERKSAQFEEDLKAAKEVVKLQSEASDIRYKMTHNDYENRKLDLLNWQQDLLNAENTTAEQRQAIEELYSAKSAQIEEEKEARLAEIRERIASADKTELEKRIADIEKEKESWIQAGMEKAEAEQLAQQQLTDYLKKTEQELSGSLQALYNTELENRLAQIEKEKQAWIDKCGDEVKATQLAEQAKADAQRQAAMSVLKQQAEEYEAYQKGGYAGLRGYKAAKLMEQGVNPDYLYMTPEQLADFQKANQVAEKSMLPNFMTDHDKAEHQQQMANWRDWQAQRNAEYDKQNYVIVDGVKVGMSEALRETPIQFTLDNKGNGDEEHTIKISPDGDSYTKTDTKSSYDKDGRLSQQDATIRNGQMPTIAEPSAQYVPEDYSELSQAVHGVTESFSEITPAMQNITESLSELPTATQNVTESLNEMPQAVQGVTENLSNVPELENESLVNPFANLESEIENLVQNFSGINEELANTTTSLGDFATAFASLSENLSSIELPKIEEPTAQYETTDYSELNQAVQGVASSFSEIPAATQNVTESLNELPQAVQGVIENLSDIPQIGNEELNDPFANLEPEIENTIKHFSDLNSELENTTANFANTIKELEQNFLDLAKVVKDANIDDAPQKAQLDDRLEITPPNIDLSALETSLSDIGANVQSILQVVQEKKNVPDISEEIPDTTKFLDALQEAEQNIKALGEQAQKTAEQMSSIQNGSYTHDSPEVNYPDINQPITTAEAPAEVTSVLESFSEVSQAAQSLSEKLISIEMPQFSEVENLFSSVDSELQNFVQTFSGVNSELQNFTQTFSGVDSELQNFTQSFSEVDSGLQNFVQTFSVMGEGVSEVTVKLSELSTALANRSLSQTNSSQAAQKTPVNVNTTVSIEEAHAWDYDHIQDLADKVADVITPQIISAIGGDSNSY